jgi:hypothetical protein
MSGMGTLTPGPPLAGLATLGLTPHSNKEWDQMSMYSQRTDRSVPRARMYHMERAGEPLKSERHRFLHLFTFRPGAWSGEFHSYLI